jgi:hypothetical protein
MTSKDYQLEELENAAVKKSNNAKRVAAAAGLMAVGGTAGAAAGVHMSSNNSDAETEEVDKLDTEEMEGTLNTAANQVHEPEPAPQPINNGGGSTGGHRPTPTNDDDVDVNFESSTNYYDENGNLMMITEDGKVNGHDFRVVDADADGKGDLLAIDANGNGIYEDGEIYTLTGSDQIAMGNPTPHHENVYLADTEPEVEPEPYDIYDDKDLAEDTSSQDMFDEKSDEIDNGQELEEENYYMAQEETEDSSFDDLGPDMDFA